MMERFKRFIDKERPWEKVRQYPFNEENISNVPEEAGVYFLFDDSELIYIGGSDGTKTSNIRSRLIDHLNGDDPCKAATDQFGYKLSDQGTRLERAVRRLYVEDNGERPRCNDKD